MQTEPIEFHGTYRYADPAALERALVAVRVQLDARQHADHERVEWMRCFIRRGTQLFVHARIENANDPDVAIAVVETLARSAVEGLVEARRGEVAVEYFPCGEIYSTKYGCT